MNNLFNPDNGFFRLMGKAWDVILASVLWLVCCIPLYFVVTIVASNLEHPVILLMFIVLDAVLMIPVGPAMASLYYVCMKVVRRERGYVFREYVHAFKMNFKVGAVTGAMIGALITLLSFNLQYAYAMAGVEEASVGMGSVVLVVTLAICFVLAGLLMVIFPVLSRFTMGVKQLFKTSLFIAFRHLPYTLLMLIIVLAGVLVMYLIVPAIFFMPGVCALVCSFPMERVLKKYMPKPENTAAADGVFVREGDVVSEEDGERKDLWYLE